MTDGLVATLAAELVAGDTANVRRLLAADARSVLAWEALRTVGEYDLDRLVALAADALARHDAGDGVG